MKNIDMRILIVVLFLLSFGAIKAQKQVLVFFNDSLKKSAQIPLKGLLMVEYEGYLKQIEVSNNSLIKITDNSIVLGKPRIVGIPTEQREIRLDDITGFRKISAGSVLLKSLLTVGTTLGAYYAFSDNTSMNVTERLLLSTTIGISTRISINLLFPKKKVKHHMKDGWRIILL